MSNSSKATRVAGLILLMVAGLFAILFGWSFIEDRVFPTPVSLRNFTAVDVSSWDQGSVSAQGTWQAERRYDRPLALTLDKQLNVSKIDCARQSGFCEVAAALLDYNKPNRYYLDLEINRLPITKWSDSTLEFSAGDPSADCFIETYVITRSTKTVTGVSTADGKCPGSQEGVDRKPLQVSLISGSEAISRSRKDEEGPTRAVIFGIVAAFTIAWLSLSAIWIVRTIRR